MISRSRHKTVKPARLTAKFAALAFAVLAVWVHPAISGQPAADVKPGVDWPLVNGDMHNSRYSLLNQINVDNIHRLGGAWISEAFEKGLVSRSSPIVVNGLLYVTAGPEIYAFDAATGKAAWRYRHDPEPNAEGNLIQIYMSGAGVPHAEGVTYAEGKIFAALSSGRLLALDATSGEFLWESDVGDDPRVRGAGAAGAPTYANGRVIVGLVGDIGYRAKIVAVNARSGKREWTFSVIPEPGSPGHDSWDPENNVWRIGGGGVWKIGSVDSNLNLVYFGTGNPVPQTAGEVRPGNNLYTDSVVALDITTGALKWHFQLIHHDLWEGDIAISTVLFDFPKNGAPIPALAVMRPDGHLFVLDRRDGSPLIPVEEKAVPQAQEQMTSPTQPFTVGAKSFLPDCDDWNDELPRILDGFRLRCFFEPPRTNLPNLLVPSIDPAGARVSPMAHSPLTGYLYVKGLAALEWSRRIQDPFFMFGSDPPPGIRSYGVLAAIDVASGELVWSKNFPSGRGSGILATSGGLIFHNAGDGHVEAYDAKSGTLKWQFQTGYPGGSGPAASYDIEGTQYVAFAAGPSIWAFKIDGNLDAGKEPYLPPAAKGPISGVIEDTDLIETASLRRDVGLTGKRFSTDEHTFSPRRARTSRGSTVTWQNNGTLNHMIQAIDDSWSTAEIQPAHQGSVLFDKAGTYLYRCAFHPWAVAELTIVE